MATITQPPLHRFSYEEWDRIVESGVMAGKRVELIDGKVIDMSPQWEPHVAGVTLTAGALRKVFDETQFSVRVQAPIRLGRESDPEPDVAVVAGTVRENLKSGRPQQALLVVEVADSSLNFDRDEKAALYAAAGIADYWIVNLNERQLEVHRKPVEDPRERFGFRYAEVMNHTVGASVAPLANRMKAIAVADLLP
jgi:Uma2 family endonuclease